MVFELLYKNQLENQCNIICSSASLLKDKVKASSFILNLFAVIKKIPKRALSAFIELLDTSCVLLVVHFYIELKKLVYSLLREIYKMHSKNRKSYQMG